jgi:hypothetical protein
LQQRFAIAHNPLILNYHSPNILKQRTACSSASLSLTTPILNDSYGALRYRTPHPQTAIAHNPNFKRFLRSASLSHPNIPKRDRTTPILNDSYGALRYRIPHPQTANCLQQRFAIAHNPLILNDSYGALRYCTPTFPKQRSISFSRHHHENLCLKEPILLHQFHHLFP